MADLAANILVVSSANERAEIVDILVHGGYDNLTVGDGDDETLVSFHRDQPSVVVVWRIFEARRLSDEPLTLEELSQEFDVSRERIRQIEVRAFEKVQKAVKRSAQKQAAAPAAS